MDLGNYPQPPALTDEEVEAFLKEAPLARVSSHNPDGTIHIAPVWFTYDQGELWLGTQKVTRKVRNIRSNSQVSLLIDNHEIPYKALLIYGQAELDEEDAVAKRATIFAKYMSPEEATGLANSLADQYEPMIIRIKPEKIVSFDYAKLEA